MLRTIAGFASAVVVAAALVSCSLPGSGGDTTGELVTDLSLSQSPYLVLDLQTGTITGFAELPDLLTNDAYQSTSMVFRLIKNGSTTIGAPAGVMGDGFDAAARSVNVPRFYCAVFEITQGQWQRLSTTTPWIGITILPSGGTTYTLTPDDTHPAYGLSRGLVEDVMQEHNTGKQYRLALPSDVQWERACRGGTSTPFFWGTDGSNRTAAAPFAQVNETRGSTIGPVAVTAHEPNPFGLYGIQGNVWELTSTGTTDASLRGGSWFDSMSLARSSNIVHIDPDSPHALAGARLVLIP